MRALRGIGWAALAIAGAGALAIVASLIRRP